MKDISILLYNLDQLYHVAPLTEYEQTLQTATQQVQQQFPGLTIAYAEIATVGSDRELHGGMQHVLLPQKEQGTAPPN